MKKVQSPRYSLTTFLFLLMKSLGGFPYSWKYKAGQLEVKRSPIATIWSFGMMVVMMTFSLSSIIYAPNTGTGMTAHISTCILNYVTYSILFLFFPYFILRSSSLACILSKLGDNEVDIRRSVISSRDLFQAVYITGTIGSLCFINYFAVISAIDAIDNRSRFNYKVSAGLSDLISEIMMATVSLLSYYLLKLLSLESEESVKSLCRVFEHLDEKQDDKDYRFLSIRQLFASEVKMLSHTCIYPTYRNQKREHKIQSLMVKPPECKETEDLRLNGEQEACRLVTRRLIALDEVVLEMVAYTGPLVVMILLNGTVNATTMLYLNSIKMDYYYIVYITLKTLCVVNITCIPDSLGQMRERCLRLVRKFLTTHKLSKTKEAGLLEVEKVLLTSADFDICHLFTLKRRILLPVAHAVVTYLVIAFQFGYSETPPRNCTSEA